ncbi:ATP-dependent rRNA helicase RRP3 [Dendryphion nanum]|uniref:ATP-dependent rRNA helicase RRP3 n=1 Tax=Dendryphion nanum TaxID=256645 RepID=A0A9P9ELA5_9PLEO|nr:ATP-dependent rRNA helicase RRP3 [Dendryphion nanum]
MSETKRRRLNGNASSSFGTKGNKTSKPSTKPTIKAAITQTRKSNATSTKYLPKSSEPSRFVPNPIAKDDTESDAESFKSFGSSEGEDEQADASEDEEGEGAAESHETTSVTKTSKDVAKKTFADLGVREELCEACTNLGYKYPTPIQAEAIPLSLQGRDIIGLAETGSGKTASFVLPMLQALMEKPQANFGLILAPTRELAKQIQEQVEALGSVINVKCALLLGGLDMIPQAIALSKKPHVVVATPGRLLDHLENTKGFHLKQLKYLVMDEADRLLDLDFGPILDKILKVLPREHRRTALYSATMSSKIESLQRASLQNPCRVNISSSDHATVSNLLQRFIFLPYKHKDLYLISLVNDAIGHSVIIFTRTVNEAQRVGILLRTLGFGAIPLHGQLSQSARLGALAKFKSRSRDILVATDVAARGLDIPSVDLVINLDLPADSKTYVHRVGRTARAGKSGKALSFVSQYDVEVWMRIEKALGKQIEQENIAKDEVMVLAERVAEAQRVAIKEMKDIHDSRGKRGGGMSRHGRGKRGRDDMDQEEG